MIPPSSAALQVVVEEDAQLVAELNRHYEDASPDGGLYQTEREALLDLISKHFTGQAWPRTAGLKATRRFAAQLQRTMLKAGWKADLFATEPC